MTQTNDVLCNATVQVTEFKGNKMIELKSDPDDKFPFSFGVGKAKKILSNIDAIKLFVDKYDKSKKDKTSHEE